MNRSFYGKPDAEFVAGSDYFAERIGLAPADYGLTAAQATFYADLAGELSAAWMAATNPTTRTRGKVAAKNAAKAAAKKEARFLAAIIRQKPGMTTEKLIDLGLAPEDPPTPSRTPGTWPNATVVAVQGNNVKYRLRDSADPDRRGRPAGTIQATVFSHVGPEVPASADDWKFELNTGRTSFEISYPSHLPLGTKVWVCAIWVSGRKETGPACPPVSAVLMGALPLSKAA